MDIPSSRQRRDWTKNGKHGEHAASPAVHEQDGTPAAAQLSRRRLVGELVVRASRLHVQPKRSGYVIGGRFGRILELQAAVP